MNNQRMIDLVINLMSEDYANFAQASNDREQYTHNAGKVWQDWYNQFKDKCVSSVGRNYIKISHDRSVAAFIVINENDTKFQVGDLLKPASWKSPTRNFQRGNVINALPETIRWTGV
jgi:hypothetical protein